MAVSVISCKKENNNAGAGNHSCGKRNTPAPAGLAGNWASGYASFAEVVDTFTGKHLGNAWSSGKFFKFTSKGKGAEFYYLVETQFSQAATKATGNITFDAGFTAEEGAFTLYTCWAHYNGRGTTTVNRDATESELENNLSIKFSTAWKVNGYALNPTEK